MSTNFSAAELAALQTATNASLDQTCTITRLTNGKDGTGYTTHTSTVIATTSARVSLPTGSYIQNLGDRMSDLKTWLVTLPVGTDVRTNDTLTVNGLALTVQTVFTPQSYQTAVRLLASEIA